MTKFFFSDVFCRILSQLSVYTELGTGLRSTAWGNVPKENRIPAEADILSYDYPVKPLRVAAKYSIGVTQRVVSGVGSLGTKSPRPKNQFY